VSLVGVLAPTVLCLEVSRNFTYVADYSGITILLGEATFLRVTSAGAILIPSIY